MENLISGAVKCSRSKCKFTEWCGIKEAFYWSMVAEGCHSEKKNKQQTNKQRKVVCVLEKICI